MEIGGRWFGGFGNLGFGGLGCLQAGGHFAVGAAHGVHQLGVVAVGQLVNECEHAVGIAQDDVEVAAAVAGERLVGEHLVRRTANERERRAQFVADVGVVLLFEHGGLLLKLHIHAQPVDVQNDAYDDESQCRQQQGIEHLCPRRFPERGLHDDGERRHVVGPCAAVVGGPDDQGVGTGVEVEETDGALGAQACPV